MFRMKRTRWISSALLLGVLLLPLPAMAGGFLYGGEAQGIWGGWWADLLGWLGLDSSFIDPDGQPKPAAPTWSTETDSAMIDPNGNPRPAPGPNGQP